jgi:hypothetical protein
MDIESMPAVPPILTGDDQGRLFVVLEDGGSRAPRGSILRLEYADGSLCPFFSVVQPAPGGPRRTGTLTPGTSIVCSTYRLRYLDSFNDG